MASDLIGKRKPTPKGREYPYLGINVEVGWVVAFAMPGTGTVVHDAKGNGAALYRRVMVTESDYEELRGVVILSNKKEN